MGRWTVVERPVTAFHSQRAFVTLSVCFLFFSLSFGLWKSVCMCLLCREPGLASRESVEPSLPLRQVDVDVDASSGVVFLDAVKPPPYCRNPAILSALIGSKRRHCRIRQYGGVWRLVPPGYGATLFEEKPLVWAQC